MYRHIAVFWRLRAVAAWLASCAVVYRLVEASEVPISKYAETKDKTKSSLIKG